MAVTHPPAKFGVNSSIQFGVIDIFQTWRPPPSWIFKISEFRTFLHLNGVVFALRTKFGSNICYSHWDRRTYAPNVHLMTSRELTSGYDFSSWGHFRMAATHPPTKFDANSSIQFGVIDIFLKSNMAAAAILDFQHNWISHILSS